MQISKRTTGIGICVAAFALAAGHLVAQQSTDLGDELKNSLPSREGASHSKFTTHYLLCPNTIRVEQRASVGNTVCVDYAETTHWFRVPISSARGTKCEPTL